METFGLKGNDVT